MNKLMSLLKLGLQNRHTSLSGLVWIVCKLGAIWLPKWKSQFEATEAVAVGYGLFMAGDASSSLTKDEADTVFLRKSETNQKPNP